MLSHQFCLALRELAVLADKRQDSVFADWCRQEYDTVKMPSTGTRGTVNGMLGL